MNRTYLKLLILIVLFYINSCCVHKCHRSTEEALKVSSQLISMRNLQYMVITCSKGKNQPGKVANPARGQLNRENEYFPVPVRD